MPTRPLILLACVVGLAAGPLPPVATAGPSPSRAAAADDGLGPIDRDLAPAEVDPGRTSAMAFADPRVEPTPDGESPAEEATEQPPMIPLPAALWAGLALLGGIAWRAARPGAGATRR